ncbi:MAG: alpha/beta hydrolase [Gemmatimonadota bacterium]|nr:alpha/beta hydrolase [Gemmatimonadota bacterium]
MQAIHPLRARNVRRTPFRIATPAPGTMRMNLLLTFGLAYLAFAAFAYFVSDRLIFLPPPATYRPERLRVFPVRTEDGVSIAVLHLPRREAAYTVLYSHGNGEDLGMALPALEALRQAGFAVLAYDYRGYGASEGGPPTADGAYLDIRAAYRYATAELGIPPSRIVVYGYSVGTGPSVELAAREPVGGLVVENGFVSTFRVLTGVPLLPFDKFPNLRTIRRVGCPVLVIHAMRDEVIPFSHGRRLFEAAPEPKRALWVEGAGHTNVAAVAGERYWSVLRSFTQLLEQAAPAR